MSSLSFSRMAIGSLISLWLMNLSMAAPSSQTSRKSASFFRVEIIVFENFEPLPSQESWSRIFVPTLLQTPKNPKGSGWFSNDFSPSRFELKQTDYRIAHSSHYQLLFHRAWLQKNQASHYIHQDYPQQQTIDGIVTIKPGYYYQVDVDLSLIANNQVTAPPLIQHQKIKAGKLYYLDSPKIGMLIMIKPS